MATFNPNPPVPPEIIDAAGDGSLVLFVGAGISRLIGCPSWDGFASEVLDQLTPTAIDYHEQNLISSIPDPRKRLSLAKIIEEKYGSVQIDYQRIFDKDLKDENIYKYINQFGCSFITTNYDKYIKPDNMVSNSENDWRFYELDSLLAANLDMQGSVIHLHGCIDSPKSMVVTTKDYLEHYSSEEVPEFLSYLFSSKTVLFLGYGLEELEVLEYVLKSSDQLGSGHIKLFILQGFFNADYSLYEKLEAFYKDSFNAKLIGFPLDYKSYNHQEDIIKKWGEDLIFSGHELVDELALLEAELKDD